MSSRNLNTIVRGLIALVVVYVSYKLTGTPETSSKNWDAVLLIVVSYYFKDRPIEEAETEASSAYAMALRIEIVTQFLIAVLLIGFTVLAFWKTGETAISGAWVGAVVLAVAFYFKEAESEVPPISDLRPLPNTVKEPESVAYPTGRDFQLARIYLQKHSRGLSRTLIALFVSLLTLFFVFPIYRASPTVPVQWIGIVVIVVAFYFKERKQSSNSTENAANVTLG